jgi:two-component system chemotaxis response regulator CheB
MLPPKLDAAVFVAIHSSPDSPGLLADIMGRVTQLPVTPARNGERIERGRIYIAPPDCHLLINKNRVAVVRGPKENGFRPAVDPLFRTAANTFGPRVIGILLSGGLDDGSYGLAAIKAGGGVAIVQDVNEAAVPSMPLRAIQRVDVDYRLPVGKMASTIAALLNEPLGNERGRSMSERSHEPTNDQPVSEHPLTDHELPGKPSVFTCPECGGVLFELSDEPGLRFRCHVGHGYTAEGLAHGQEKQIEDALWSAVRALEESAALRDRVRARMGTHDALQPVQTSLARQIRASKRRAETLRRLLTGREDVGENRENQAADAAWRAPGLKAGRSRRSAPRRSRKS